MGPGGGYLHCSVCGFDVQGCGLILCFRLVSAANSLQDGITIHSWLNVLHDTTQDLGPTLYLKPESCTLHNDTTSH